MNSFYGWILLFLSGFLFSGCATANDAHVDVQEKTGIIATKQSNMKSAGERVILRIDIPVFFSEINLSGIKAAKEMDSIGVRYDIGNRVNGATEEFSIGIYKNSKEAHSQFREDVQHRSMQMPSSPPRRIGDEIRCIGSMHDPDSSGLIILRRANILIETRWIGTQESAYQFAQKIDTILLHNDRICPKGDNILVPNVEISASDRVPLHDTVEIEYSTIGNVKVLVATPASSTHVWTSRGRVSYWVKDIGTQQLVLRFATQDNIIFTKTITINVVTKQEYLDSLKQRPWNIEGRFYLKDNLETKFSQIPFAKQEIILMDPGTVHSLAEDKSAGAIKRDIEEMKSVVQEAWLPETRFVQPGFDVWKPVNHEVYTAKFETKGLHILYMGRPGQSLWLYIEKTDKAKQLPKLSDVIRPEVQKDSKETVAIQSFTGHRYRAFNSNGPWESVDILVVKFEFASGLTIDSFGYKLPARKQ